jgi:PadR family transcriptional regulator, regulatory protein PadR
MHRKQDTGGFMNMKGGLPLLILHTLGQGASHGYQIAKSIKAQSEGVLGFAEGTLYPALHTLEQQGMIQAYETEENGRTRRYYRLTEAGHAALSQERVEWKQYVAAMNMILGEA